MTATTPARTLKGPDPLCSEFGPCESEVREDQAARPRVLGDRLGARVRGMGSGPVMGALDPIGQHLRGTLPRDRFPGGGPAVVQYRRGTEAAYARRFMGRVTHLESRWG